MAPETETEAAGEEGPAVGTGEVAPEVSKRVAAILDSVEQEASRLRAESEAEAREYLNAARERADRLVEMRRERISELSDELMRKAEAVASRLEDAAPVRAGFDNLVRALGDAAERLAREAESTYEAFDPQPFHVEISNRVASSAAPAEPLGGRPLTDPLAAPQVAGAATAPQASFVVAEASEPDPAPPSTSAPPEPAAAEAGATGGDEQALGSHGVSADDARVLAINLAARGATRNEVRRHLATMPGAGDPDQIADEIFGVGAADDATVPWRIQSPPG